DFHPSMEEYFLAKRRLFASELTEVRIANADDPYGRRLMDEFPCQTFAITQEADYRSVDVRTDATGCDFTAVTPDGSFAARVPLPGRFNVLNALGWGAAARTVGVAADVIPDALPDAATAPGRFQ